MNDINYLVGRTGQKLRFAEVHLGELRSHPGRESGDDFERCHHESFLFHFYGASDAFLQELNCYYGLGLSIKQVRPSTIRTRLQKAGLDSKELDSLQKFFSNTEGQVGVSKDLRDHVTHRGGIPIQHYLNGPSYLVDPESRLELKTDTVEMFSQWLADLSKLLNDLRASAGSRTSN